MGGGGGVSRVQSLKNFTGCGITAFFRPCLLATMSLVLFFSVTSQVQFLESPCLNRRQGEAVQGARLLSGLKTFRTGRLVGSALEHTFAGPQPLTFAPSAKGLSVWQPKTWVSALELGLPWGRLE